MHVAAVPAQCWSRICSHHGEETQGLAGQSQVGFPVVQFASRPFLVLDDADKPLRPVSSTDKGHVNPRGFGPAVISDAGYWCLHCSILLGFPQLTLSR